MENVCCGLDVRDFGAKGDGTTPEYAAIQDAVDKAYKNGGGIVCFSQPQVYPKGSYKLEKELIVPANVTLSFSDKAKINIDSGVMLRIAGPLHSRPGQIFSGPGKVQFQSGLVPRVYPQWWGAYDNQTNDSKTISATTLAIKAAVNSLYHPFNPRFSRQVLEFVAGKYVINDEIVFSDYANVVNGSGAIIQMINEDASKPQKIFNFNNARAIQVSGLEFQGGDVQISISNLNKEQSMFQIRNCVFESAIGYAIEAVPTPPAKIPDDHLSAVLTIENCKFLWPRAVLHNLCDYAEVSNCMVYVNDEHTPSQTAIFVNGAPRVYYGSRLHFHGLYGVPGFSPGRSFSCRWIDNYGSISIDNSRFGGENGGIPLIYHSAQHRDSPEAWPRSTSVTIRDSWVFIGQSPYDPNAAVLNLRTDVPAIFIYEGNFGPASGSLITNANGGIPNLDDYIRRFPHIKFRFVIGPNDTVVDKIPEPLKPFATFR